MTRLRSVLFCGISTVALMPYLLGGVALAQNATTAILEEITVTATKSAQGANVQNIPTAITAYGSDQLQALNFRDLQSLSYAMPNVQLEDVGTTPGVANFSIRGLGINSSIPSIDPTVGVFVDGVYMGITTGIIFDNFDVEAVEVLRGPQGVLFGRNVTGGAVLLRTTTPSDEFKVRARASLESGLNASADAMVTGPIIDGKLSAKIAIYGTTDQGWHKNLFDNSHHGAANQLVLRPALRFTPSDDLEFILRYEYGDADGDGPASQNHALYSRQSFDFAINEPGYYDNIWNQVTFETNWNVAFGDGKITNIFGWRDFKNDVLSDIDATVGTAFHAQLVSNQDQVSDELRYAGTFGPVDITTGLYYFQQDLLYIERRLLFPGVTRIGGGIGDFSTTGAFGAADWHVTDTITLNAGIRYSHEKKDSAISRVRRALDPLGGPGLDVQGEGLIGGDIATRTLNISDPGYAQKWNDVSPRIGVQWKPFEETQIYGFWARGFRSGGTNFRHTALATRPAAFDSEKQDSFEIGVKHDFGDRARLNMALFTNKIKGMQREQNLPDPLSGVVQLITNAGDATIRGFEAEGRFSVTDNLLLTFQAGYTNGKYKKITADLSGVGGVGDATDFALKIPRLSPWTYGVNAIYDFDVDWGTLSTRVGFNHRDAAFYTDNNLGTLNGVDFVDANLTFTPDDKPWSISVYASNLTNEVSYGGDTILPNVAPFGGDGAGPRPLPTFSPLNKGRVFGGELRLRF
jgi:iron complex outermembrane receptor protein